MPAVIPSIEVRNVTKRFGAVVALDHVSFTVQPGELFFLLGPSGCGKTTLLRILAGLETPDSGTILFNGRDIAGLPPHERGAPMVFQNYALWPHLNVRDNVAFGLVERKLPRNEVGSRVADVLRRVNLQGLDKRTPGQLSGGQQQRVVLARALVLNPSIVLMDEPLSNLDAKLRVEMREEIEKLHAASGITFVYVTHDQADALSLADRMVVMNAGQISAIGAPLDLYSRPPTSFCADFLGEANLIEGRVESVECRVATEGGGASAGSVCGVRTRLGVLKAVSAKPPPAGAAVTCLIRPENLLPADDRTGADNAFEAVVTGLRMNGPTVTVLLDAGGVPLKATLLTQASQILSRGDRRRWTVAAVNTILLVA